MGGSSSFTWSVGPPARSALLSTTNLSMITTTRTSYVLTDLTTISTTLVITTDDTTTIVTTVLTTAATSTSYMTLQSGVTTVFERGQFVERQVVNTYLGPESSFAGSYITGDFSYTETVYGATETTDIVVTPKSYVTNSTVTTAVETATSVINGTTTVVTVLTTYAPYTITSTTSTPTSTGGASQGPYLFSISAAGTTITQPLSRRSEPTQAPVQKRQDVTGYVGLADNNGTVGVVPDSNNALSFYIVNGELMAMVGANDWYTYTELSIIANPGYETWVLQISPPAADSIATEWTGVELGSADWTNDAFGSLGLAQMCVGTALAENPDVPVIDFWYDASLDPPGGSCALASVVLVDVNPPISTNIVTESTTVTSISIITGDPITTYVCNNGGSCPQSCSYDTVNLVTTSVCSTAADGLSTCQQCLASTPLPVIETDVAWVTATAACVSPPCAQTVTQWAGGSDTTVTVYNNNWSGNGGSSGGSSGGSDGSNNAGSGDSGAAAAASANTNLASGSSSSSATSTSKSYTRTGTPTASPSVGLAGRVEAQSSSIMALALVAGVFAFFA
ncbi:hypothetical protein ABW20_dc0107646 [Dactylellina cionopaga]|nr:hypothetical protein ABW20_dc0107646 [Dactylellina cionopaga]